MNIVSRAALCVAAFLLCGLAPAVASVQTGSASWYALTSRTANGEWCDPNAMTAAHRKLPFNTRIKVTNLRNGKSVVLRVNDRGPFAKGRVLDVTKAAAKKLDFLGRGHTNVRIERVSRSTPLGNQPRWPALTKLDVPTPTYRPEAALAMIEVPGAAPIRFY